ncbi:MAG TPA: N-6 DNA methylase, partial [Candidatus Xenobia bacterium]
MSLSRALRVEPHLPNMSQVATPRQVVARVQAAVALLAAHQPTGDAQSVYQNLLLLTSRLLFLGLAGQVDIDGPGTTDWRLRSFRNRWHARMHAAVQELAFLRAQSGLLEPGDFEPTVLAEAMEALQGDGAMLNAHTLGSAFESLLAFHPVVDRGVLSFATAAGNSRKTTGSYYTPDALIQCLLDTALDPLKGSPLKVCDPSCGSGQFLLA